MKPIIKEKKAKKKKFNWSEFLRYFRTIWKNDACIDCSIVPRKKNNFTGAKYWWISIPVFLSAIVLAMTPLTVHASQQKGSTAFAQRTYGIDDVLYDAFSNEENNDSFVNLGADFGKLSFVDHKAVLDTEINPKYNFSIEGETNSDYTLIGFHKQLEKNSENTGSVEVKNFEVYYIPETSEKNLQKILKVITDKEFVLTADIAKDDVNVDFTSKVVRAHSFIAFGSKEVTLHIAGLQTKSGVGKIVGDYKHLQNASLKDLMTVKTNESDILNKDLVMKNFKKFADNIYENNRIAITAAQSGISLAINGGVTILLGFIMFALTRGKQNPNRYIKWYETLNMAMWASFLPGLIALILGFIFSGMEMMLFLITFGFRTMWMSMRNLRPQSY